MKKNTCHPPLSHRALACFGNNSHPFYLFWLTIEGRQTRKAATNAVCRHLPFTVLPFFVGDAQQERLSLLCLYLPREGLPFFPFINKNLEFLCIMYKKPIKIL